MKVIFHGNETFFDNPEWAFKRIPDGVYSVRTTVHPDEGEPYDVQTPAELREGTLYVPSQSEFAPEPYPCGHPHYMRTKEGKHYCKQYPDGT